MAEKRTSWGENGETREVAGGRKITLGGKLTSEIPEEGWGEVFAKCRLRGALKVVGWTLDVSKRRWFRAGQAGEWTRFFASDGSESTLDPRHPG